MPASCRKPARRLADGRLCSFRVRPVPRRGDHRPVLRAAGDRSCRGRTRSSRIAAARWPTRPRRRPAVARRRLACGRRRRRRLGRLARGAAAIPGRGLRWLARLPGFPTPLAFVLVNEAAEPDFIVYGEGIEAGILSLEERLEEAIAAHDALLFGSNTLLGARERALTLRARDLALAAGKHVLFDPNLRMRRWRDRSEAVEMTAAALEDDDSAEGEPRGGGAALRPSRPGGGGGAAGRDGRPAGGGHARARRRAAARRGHAPRRPACPPRRSTPPARATWSPAC